MFGYYLPFLRNRFYYTFAPQISIMTIHREGYRTIGITALIFGVINLISISFNSASVITLPVLTVSYQRHTFHRVLAIQFYSGYNRFPDK